MTSALYYYAVGSRQVYDITIIHALCSDMYFSDSEHTCMSQETINFTMKCVIWGYVKSLKKCGKGARSL